jgi:hypothetical protein
MRRPWRRTLGGTSARYAVGVAVALLPSVLYLTHESAWADFANRLFGIHLDESYGYEIRPLRWMSNSLSDFASESAFLVASLIGVIVFGLRGARRKSQNRGRRQIAARWLDARYAGMPVMLLGWAVYNAIDFQRYPDLLPVLPVIAFFAAWGTAEALRALTARGGWWATTAGRRWVSAMWGCIVLVAAIYGFGDTRDFAPSTTLDAQLASARELGPGTVVSFGADALYALREQRPPFPFLRLVPRFENHLEFAVPGGCGQVFRNLVELSPIAIAVRVPLQGECINRIAGKALEAGYRRNAVAWYPPPHGDWGRPTLDEQRTIIWHVYRRP